MDQEGSPVIFYLSLYIPFFSRQVFYCFMQQKFVGYPVPDVILSHQYAVFMGGALGNEIRNLCAV